MRKWIAWLLIVSALALLAVSASADRKLITVSRTRTALRGYNGATVQQYDTLAASSGERVELDNFQIYADDSAQTPTLTAWFVSSISKTVYLKLSETYTANQIKTTLWAGPFSVAFPKDSTILVYYNITGATPGTLDTLIASTTYRLERP